MPITESGRTGPCEVAGELATPPSWRTSSTDRVNVYRLRAVQATPPSANFRIGWIVSSGSAVGQSARVRRARENRRYGSAEQHGSLPPAVGFGGEVCNLATARGCAGQCHTSHPKLDSGRRLEYILGTKIYNKKILTSDYVV